MKHPFTAVMFLALLTALALPAAAGEYKQRCARCNMLLDEAAPFSARIIAEDRALWFCDIGDMVLYLREKKSDPAKAQVKDYPSGAWLAAGKAWYVSDPKKFRTPMGWGLAAFTDRAVASRHGTAEDLSTILKRIE